MKSVAFALTLAISGGFLLGPNPAEARQVCKWLKVNPNCWGDVCKTKRVCYNVSPFKDGISARR
jgi:hypothetical protein